MTSDAFKDFVLDQLHAIEDLKCKRMFGGFGLYAGTTFFAIISDGRLYFKTDESSRREYVRREMQPFQPTPRQSLKAYYEVPADVIEDATQLEQWARAAVKVAAE
ncbi:MAG: TfoX family protein [Verrucomicrobia bacterium]|nr:MAG: TfoX family protein [Verrucomicrobiota bacterium]